MFYSQKPRQFLARDAGLWQDARRLFMATGRVLTQPQRQVKGHKRLYASSLAFKTLLAMVPALAIVMAVLAYDAFSRQREQILDQMVDAIYPVQTQAGGTFLDPDEPKSLSQLNQQGKQQIRRSVRKFALHARKVGLIGFAGFLVVVFLLLRDVETSFNFLWGVDRQRPLFAQMARHGFFFVGLPVLAVLIMTLEGWLGGWHLSKALPFAALWAACAWMYLLIPNARVEKKSAVFTGLLVALLLEAARWGMNWYTLKVLERSHVYGALWTFPVILIWFYLSWTIILFGAEVAYVYQHRGQGMEKRR